MYVGGELSSFWRDGGRKTELTARRMADSGGEMLHDKVVENTPIGGTDFPGEGGGNLRSSWYRTPVNKKGTLLGTAYETEVATDVDYAPYVEHGTGLWGPSHSKYLIKPKTAEGTLRWRDRETGRWVYAKYVWHPGSPGQHMMSIAAAYTEHAWDNRAAATILDEWRQMIEAQGSSSPLHGPGRL